MNRIAILLILTFSVLPSIEAQEEWSKKEIRIRDFGALVEESQQKSISIRARNRTFGTGPSETLAPYPLPLDQRREAIIDALWNNDESAFYELARSPLTFDGGLVNQTFDRISRELRKYDRYPLRTERHHPVYPPGELSVWCRHQWMSILDGDKKGRRGNLNLIFDKDDWSLRFVRIVFFDNGGSYLHPPMSLLPNDIIVDRPVPDDEEK